MNSFESDMGRAIMSKKFFVGIVIQLLILFNSGFDSELFRMSVPVVCTLPYTCGWLNEYNNGFVKFTLSRTSYNAYIISKFLACGISGGIVEVFAAWIYILCKNDNEISCEYGLLFLSGMLWAVIAATLAALSNSKYVAYGSSFIIFYFLVIFQKRYWISLYCLNPYEWFAPSHTWMFDTSGVVIMLIGFVVVMFIAYYSIIKRRLDNV